MEETNENKKDEINYIAPVVEFDNKRSIVTNIGFTAKSKDKYQIVWPVPQVSDGLEIAEAESKDRYDCDIQTLIEAGIRQFTTRPDYKGVGFNDDGTLKPDGHEEMQKLADGYKVGQRQVGVGVKAVAQRAKKAEEEVGMTLEQMTAKIKELKDQGLLD